MSESITLKTVVSDCLTAQGPDFLKDTQRFVSVVKDYSKGSLQNQDYLMKIMGDEKFLSYYLNAGDNEDELVLAYKNSYDYLVDHYPFNETWMKHICSEVHDAFLEYVRKGKRKTAGASDMTGGSAAKENVVQTAPEEAIPATREEHTYSDADRSSTRNRSFGGLQNISMNGNHVIALCLASLLALILMFTFIGKYSHLQNSVNKLGMSQDEKIYSKYAVVVITDSSSEEVTLYSEYDHDRFRAKYPSKLNVTFAKNNKIHIEMKKSGIGLIKCTSDKSNGFFYIMVIGINER